MDELVQIGRPVSEAILLALLVTPLLRVVTPEHPYLGEKERYIYWVQTLRLVLHQILAPFSFPRGTKEMAAQVLTAQSSLKRSVRYGRIHKRLRMKKYFQEAALFFGIEAQAKGERVPHLLRRAVPPDFVPWWPKEFKRRHRR